MSDDLTENFSRREFACQGLNCCGHSAPISMVLVRALQRLRDDLSLVFNREYVIEITSGFRCITHDLAEAARRGETPDQIAARNSQHCRGTAADIHIQYIDPEEIAAIAENIPAFHNNGGIGIYEWGVHLDVREDGPVRWNG